MIVENGHPKRLEFSFITYLNAYSHCSAKVVTCEHKDMTDNVSGG